MPNQAQQNYLSRLRNALISVSPLNPALGVQGIDGGTPYEKYCNLRATIQGNKYVLVALNFGMLLMTGGLALVGGALLEFSYLKILFLVLAPLLFMDACYVFYKRMQLRQ